MSSTSLRVAVPVCSFRKAYAREFLATERIPPPSTVYGFLLSLVGVEDRYAHIGTKVAIAVTQLPEVSRVVRTIWSIRNKEIPPGIGNNKRPDYQEILTGLEIGIWVAPGPLATQLQTAGNSPKAISRYGGLSLGESRDLVDEVDFQPRWTGNGLWLVPSSNGDQPLPVWVDHVGSKGTHWMQFRLTEAPLMDPSPDDERWITISPP